MILKGNQRKGARDLATHLLNMADNEQIDVAEIAGAIADDLHGAFAEYEALAVGTLCKKPLYSLSINPSAPISRSQYAEAINLIESRLGFTGQPRSIIFHIKQGSGREHCHVVWSRIDVKKMRAVHLSHDHLKLRTLSRELADRFNLDLPPGLVEDRNRDHITSPDVGLSEKAKAEKSGIKPAERKAEITTAFRHSDSPAAFAPALEDRGYFLAKGDRRSFVVIDRYGDVHSLARQIDGVNTRQLKGFLEGLALPGVQEAKKHAASLEQDDENHHHELFEVQLVDALKVLRHKQASRRLKHLLGSRQLRSKFGNERHMLSTAQKKERETSRGSRVVSAAVRLFSRVPVLRSVLIHLRRKGFQTLEERHDNEMLALTRRHEREMLDLARRYSALRMVEKREKQVLARTLLRGIRARDHKHDMFDVTAKDITETHLGAYVSDDVFKEAPTQAEQAILNTFIEEELSSIFNRHALAGLVEWEESDASEQHLDASDGQFFETDIALFEFGLSPRFNHHSGVEESSTETEAFDDELKLDREDPTSRPSQ